MVFSGLYCLWTKNFVRAGEIRFIIFGMLIYSPKKEEYLALKEQIFQIFLAQSKYHTYDKENQLSYFNKWVDIYYSNWPDWFFLAVESGVVLGYICACPDSLKAMAIIPFKSYALFKDYYPQHPVHFHINVKSGITGKGIGSKLLRELSEKAMESKCASLHILTSDTEKNVEFYNKNHFTVVGTKNLGEHQLQLMALDLGLSFLYKVDKSLQT